MFSFDFKLTIEIVQVKFVTCTVAEMKVVSQKIKKFGPHTKKKKKKKEKKKKRRRKKERKGCV
jgi:hypothetical protein